MSLETSIMAELKTAMKAKDEAALRTLRAIKAEILVFKTSEGGSDTLKEADELKILTKMAKQRQDSLTMYTQNGREDLAVKEKEELAILEKFLPQQLNEEELTEALKNIISETGATTIKDL